MKIVNRKQFLELPENTLFSTYMPVVVGGLSIKCCNPGELKYDFLYSNIIGAIEHNNSDEYLETLIKMEENGVSVESDFNLSGRDGFFTDDELYFIYEKKDVQKLIERLKECL